MIIYETGEMEEHEAIQFINLFDFYIGTEREINETECGIYIVCCDLTGYDADKCQEYETISTTNPTYPYTWEKLQALNLPGDKLAEKIGLKVYDTALPQDWLNSFTKAHNLDYDKVRYSTFYSYDGSLFGFPVSAWQSAQSAIDKDQRGMTP